MDWQKRLISNKALFFNADAQYHKEISSAIEPMREGESVRKRCLLGRITGGQAGCHGVSGCQSSREKTKMPVRLLPRFVVTFCPTRIAL
jgi:hypothetical protein